MSDDDSSEEYVIKRSTGNIDESETVYAKAPTKQDAKELFDHASD